MLLYVCKRVCVHNDQTLEKGKLFKHHSKWIEHKLCCLNGMNVNNFFSAIPSIQNMFDSEDTHIPY